MERIPTQKHALFFAVALVALVLSCSFCAQSYAISQTQPVLVLAQSSASNSNTVTDFAFLKGRWRRPDGGYIMDIKDVDSAGKIDAAYYNPNPIKVSKAEASKEGSEAKVFIELRDVGYPGCTYTLAYDPQTDHLKGIYFQAAIGQKFYVFFSRIK
jgi:hypothetical protein